ncbi:MAG: PorT family protein, partial [Muribaculaceae bacterium]|nr:PorT family protein [Muribaculaceae bacterium]
LGVISCYAEKENDNILWGIKVSVGAELPSKWYLDGDGVSMYRPGVGVTIGSVCNIYLGKNFYFEPGISLFHTHYKYKDLVFTNATGEIKETDPQIIKWGIQIPFVVGYDINCSDKFAMNVFTGPQIRYAFSGEIKFKNKEIQEEASEFVNLWNGQRRFDLSWKIGVGFPVSSLLLSIEADLGITDLLKSNLSFRENRVGIGATYFF